MAIDRVGRARRRRELRAAAQILAPSGSRHRVAAASMEVEGLFNPGRKHQLERLEWVAVAKEDERESGAGPLDLDSGVVRLQRQDDSGEPNQ